MYDKLGIDREGKDIDHKTPISKGGKSVRSNLRLQSPNANRSFKRNADGSIKK
jgi:5-methylcytosine-specific restriction endonuclease McrA